MANFANLNISFIFHKLLISYIAAAHRLRIGLYLITSLTLKMARPTLFHSPQRDTLRSSGCVMIMF